MSETITLCPYVWEGKTHYTTNCKKLIPDCEKSHFQIVLPNGRLSLNDYQEAAAKTAVYPRGKVIASGNFVDMGLNYAVAGLTSEAGEVSGQLAKMVRDDKGRMTEERKLKFMKELGDALWCCAAVARELEVTLEEVAQMNIDKLAKRQEENKLHGSGDER